MKYNSFRMSPMGDIIIASICGLLLIGLCALAVMADHQQTERCMHRKLLDCKMHCLRFYDTKQCDAYCDQLYGDKQ